VSVAQIAGFGGKQNVENDPGGSGKREVSVPIAGINMTRRYLLLRGPYDAFTHNSIAGEEIVCSPRIQFIDWMHWLMGQNHGNHFPMAAEIRGHTNVTM
jgi:hypothetical protein